MWLGLKEMSFQCRYFDGLLERGGVAQIVTGFTQRRPAFIEQGAKLLDKRRNVSILTHGLFLPLLCTETCRMRAQARGEPLAISTHLAAPFWP